MSAKILSRNPVDGAIVWQGNTSSSEEISLAIKQAAAAQNAWKSVPCEARFEIARRYAAHLRQYRDEIEALLVLEVGKLKADAVSEVDAAISKAENSIASLEQRRSVTRSESSGLTRQVRYRPLGVVVVLGPFNFPLHLPGAQLIPALLAGNAVVFKPSEHATAIGEWMINAWKHAGLPADVLQLIVGGADVAEAAVDSKMVGGVFLTGSQRVGLALRHRLVERYDVLLAMELGGNNPIVVDSQVPPEIAAGIVTHSAFVSSGQRCTCARRAIIIDGEQSQEQIGAIVKRASRLTIGTPNAVPPPDLGPLISPRAVGEIERFYEELIRRGCRSLLAPQRDHACKTSIGPAIVDATELSKNDFREIGNREWFGPLLVIRRVDDFESAIEAASATSYGLAAALLGGDSEMFERFADEVGAGVVNWNRGTTGAAGLQPFGGLGQSGNHRPAGFFAIDSCNDPVASLASNQLPTDDPWKS